jgi:hypothetical protein
LTNFLGPDIIYIQRLLEVIWAMKRNKLLFLLIISIISFFCITNIGKSDNVMVGFSDSKFLYWWSEEDTISFTISWWVETWFSIKVYNKEDISMTYKLWSVDAGTTNDSFNDKTCLGENQTWVFGQYILGDKSSKTIPSWWSWIRNLTAQFPNYYSWIYNWCITFHPSIVWWTTVDTLPRRWNFIDVTVRSVWINLNLKAFPSNRINQSSNNTNSWIVKIYNTSKVLQRTIDIWLNGNWTWALFTDIAPGTYYFIFKWQSQLASYISWVIISWSWSQTIDFTTWANLYGTQKLNMTQDDWYRYQTAGDLKSAQWVYDYMVNGNDISIITANWLFDNGISVLDPRNLNGDIAVNASDIAVIWINFQLKDPYYTNTFSW